MTLFGFPVEPEVQIKNAGAVTEIDKFRFSTARLRSLESIVKVAACSLKVLVKDLWIASVTTRLTCDSAKTALARSLGKFGSILTTNLPAFRIPNVAASSST